MDLIDRSYYDVLSEQAALYPDRDAVVMGEEHLTYSAMVRQVDRIARGLAASGIRRGDRVTLWGAASPQWLCCYYGIIRAGAVAVVLNANLTVKDAVPLITYVDSVAVLFGKSHDLKGAAAEAASLAEQCGLSAGRVIPLSDVPMADAPDIDRTGWSTHEDAYVIYTSGTTAFPKAVATAQFGIINSCARLAKAIHREEAHRAVMAVPLFHAYGLMVSWIYLQHGGTVIIPGRIKAEDVADAVEQGDATDLWSVAVIYQGLIDNPLLKERVADRLELCTIAGSYTTPVQFMRYESNLHRATFVNMYGMTETCAAWCLTRPEDSENIRYTTVGQAIEDVEAAICDAEGSILPPGNVGEVITRGFHLKNSYLKLPPEKQAVDADGWLHSGDLGVMDAEGHLQIVGRIKDIIIKGGENIAPAEIEAEAMAVDCVKSCRIFGYRDRIYGENLAACIIPQEGVPFDESEVRDHIKAVMGSYKTPAYYILFDSFPLNANGKVDQRALHMDMLYRMHRLAISGKLQKGIRIMAVSMKNSAYCTVPMADLAESCSLNLGFGPQKAARIRLAVEEMMSLRVSEAGESIGDIQMEILCYTNYLRVAFTDPNMVPELDGEQRENRRISMAIITRMADDTFIEPETKSNFYAEIDFAYDRDFNVQDFLMQHERIE